LEPYHFIFLFDCSKSQSSGQRFQPVARSRNPATVRFERHGFRFVELLTKDLSKFRHVYFSANPPASAGCQPSNAHH
jgi:hypothetical protein